MNLDSKDIAFKLKEHLKLEITASEIVLTKSTGSWTIPRGMVIDDQALINSQVFCARDQDQLTTELFKKFLKTMIEDDLIIISLGSGIQLHRLSWSLLQELLRPNVSASSKIKLSPDTIIRTMGPDLEIINSRNGVIGVVEQSLFFDALAGKNMIVCEQLIGLGIFTTSTPKESSSDLSDAFHLQNTCDLEPVRNRNYKMQLPWKGKPHFSKFIESEFVQTLKKRRSFESESNIQKASLDEIKELLLVTYGADTETNGEVKFFYPSPGRGYSVTLRILIPVNDGVELHKYNPLTGSLELIGKAKSKSEHLSWTRILCVGDSSELKKRYNTIPYRLMLLETGVILQQLSLATAFLNLAGKIIGHTNEKAVKDTFKGCFSDQEQILGEYIVVKPGNA